MPSLNARRKHCLEVHAFEPSFFFAVIKYGIGSQLRAWATGQERTSLPSTSKGSSTAAPAKTQADGETPKDPVSVRKPGRSRDTNPRKPQRDTATSQPPKAHDDVESITAGLDRVSFVPTSIRFGRGGRKGGFERPKHSKHAAANSKAAVPRNGKGKGYGSVEMTKDSVGIRFASTIDPTYNADDSRMKTRKGGRKGRGEQQDTPVEA